MSRRFPIHHVTFQIYYIIQTPKQFPILNGIKQSDAWVIDKKKFGEKRFLHYLIYLRVYDIPDMVGKSLF